MTAPDCPRINVNPKKCDDALTCVSSEDECKAAPILIPCPLPRSVTFTVRLGECSARTEDHCGGPCVCAPIRVSCSIGGKTWEESEVVSVERCDGALMKGTGEDVMRVVALCRELWALVKALVLGYTAWDYTMSHAKAVPLATITSMLAQRDAVFAALADMARAEDAISTSRQRAYDAMDGSGYTADSEHMRARSTTRESVDVLAAYVEYLVEQVGVLL